jgi:hypothetical protein
MDRTLEVNFCFDLVCKAVMKVQRNSIVFTYMGAPHVQKNQMFFFAFCINISHKFITFFSCHFVILCSLMISSSLCYGKTRKSHALCK